MSSIWHTTPSRLARIPLIRLWKCSGALEIPKGNLLKQNLPNGVINVVRRRDAGESGICQNPLFASSLVNILASVSCARVLSTLGSGWTSLRTLLLRGLRLTHILTPPDFFGATTIPAHQGVGTSTLDDSHGLHSLKFLGDSF